MAYELTVFPSVEPVTVEEFRKQARIDDDLTLEDVVALQYIRAAREMLEVETGQSCLTQTGVAYFDGFPRCGDDGPRRLKLPRWPVSSVTSLEYRDEDGDWVALASSEWELATGKPAEIWLAPSSSWPSTYGLRRRSVRATFVNGHAERERVPLTLRQAILLQAEHFYEKRSPISDRITYSLSRSVEALLDLNRTEVYV